MGARSHVFAVHQDGRRPEAAVVLRAPGITRIPLRPHGRYVQVAERLRERIPGLADVGAARIVDELDMKPERRVLLLRAGDETGVT